MNLLNKLWKALKKLIAVESNSKYIDRNSCETLYFFQYYFPNLMAHMKKNKGEILSKYIGFKWLKENGSLANVYNPGIKKREKRKRKFGKYKQFRQKKSRYLPIFVHLKIILVTAWYFCVNVMRMTMIWINANAVRRPLNTMPVRVDIKFADAESSFLMHVKCFKLRC